MHGIQFKVHDNERTVTKILLCELIVYMSSSQYQCSSQSKCSSQS